MPEIFTAFALFTKYEILSYETPKGFPLQLDPSLKGLGIEKKIKILHLMGLKNILLQSREGN